MKCLTLLGSTGSIGTQSLEVLDGLPEQFEVLALTARSNVSLLATQARKYNVQAVALEYEAGLDDLKALLRELRVENGANDDEIADELERRKVKPRNWTAFRVRCLVRGLVIHRKTGRKTAAEEAANGVGKQGVSESGSKSKRNRTVASSRRRKLVRAQSDHYEALDC